MMRRRAILGFVVAVVVLAACGAPAPPSGPAQSGPSSAAPAAPKRVTAAIIGELAGLGISTSALAPAGGPEVLSLMNSGLTAPDTQGVLQPQLATSVPSIENGGWRLLPDGSMELTWAIRPGTTWHDGTAFTADDLVFSLQVLRDKDLLIPSQGPIFESMGTVTAPDARTIAVTWSKPYLAADTLFNWAQILPRHVLEPVYAQSKETLFGAPYWTNEFVGQGPFKLQEWVPGSHLIVVANPSYSLGRPKLDEIEVKFIQDQNTLVANLLAGTVDVTITRGLELDSGLELQGRWANGRIETGPANPLILYGQFIEPLSPVMLELPFRRALLHALDRQEMVNVFLQGLSTVADAPFLLPGPELRRVDSSIVRYPYDPRRADELLEGLGYRKGTDGFYADARGQPLEVRVTANPTNTIQIKSMASVADYWQRAGIKVEQEQTTLARVRDPQFLSGHPGYWLARQPTTIDNLVSSKVGLPENNYRGTNFVRYRNTELDALVNRYLVTIPIEPRMEALGQITRHLTEQVVLMGLMYDVQVSAFSNRLRSVTGRNNAATETWNVHDWDVS